MLLPQISSMSLHSKTKPGKVTPESRVNALPAAILSRTKQIFQRLRIGKKIGYGYAVAIGIAILGTAIGLTVGEFMRREAVHQQQVAHQQQKLVQNLQNAILQARSHSLHFPVVLGNNLGLKYENTEFLEQTNRAKKLLDETKLFIKTQRHYLADEAEELEGLLNRYTILLEYYAGVTQSQLKEVNAWNLKPEEIQPAQLQLLRISSGEDSILLGELADSLNEQISAAVNRELEATESLYSAEKLRVGIIVASMLLSAAIAAILAFYTSRAIARPVQAVTQVAQQVATEHNFNLRAPITNEDEIGLLATSLNHLIEQVADYTEKLKQTQSQLIQTEKMSSIGQMVAGVAHEINNPINFIHSNIEYINNYIQNLLELVSLYQKQYPHPTVEIQEHIEEIDLDFITQDLPKALSSMQMGSDRIREIVVSMRNFSRADNTYMTPMDIHKGIDSTLAILNHRLKLGIKVIKKYDKLPGVDCYPAQLNQVFMNILSNAIDALEEVNNSGKWQVAESPTICICTAVEALTEISQKNVKVIIGDNGPGIPKETQQKMFEPFFTTKSIGKGTGLGLAISYQIIAKHNGKIEVNSEPGKGTEFVITLPVTAAIA